MIVALNFFFLCIIIWFVKLCYRNHAQICPWLLKLKISIVRGGGRICNIEELKGENLNFEVVGGFLNMGGFA